MTDEEITEAVARIDAAIAHISDMEPRILKALDLVDQALVQRFENSRQHISQLWESLDLRGTRNELHAIKRLLGEAVTALELRLAFGAAVLALVVALLGAFAWHERTVGQTAVHSADAKALQAARDLADEQTRHNADVAATAALGARNAQKTLDDYVAAHPQQPIWLCHGTGDSGSGVSPAGAVVSGKPDPGPGPAPVSAVLAGDKGPAVDVSTDIDALVQAAGRMAVVYAELQQVRK